MDFCNATRLNTCKAMALQTVIDTLVHKVVNCRYAFGSAPGTFRDITINGAWTSKAGEICLRITDVDGQEKTYTCHCLVIFSTFIFCGVGP